MPSQPSQFRDRHSENQLFRFRLLVAALVVVLMSLGLMARMIWLQWLQHDYFSTLSNKNSVQLQPIAPPRGLILDRRGRVLVTNRPDLSVSIVPEQVRNMDATLTTVRSLINLSDNDLDSFRQRLVSPRHPWEPVPLRSRLNDTEIASLAASEFMLPGVRIEADAIRHYPYRDMLSHVLGYVSRVSAKDIESMTPEQLENYNGTHFYGRSGIERSYENVLHGKVGYRRAEVNARGRLLRMLGETPPVRGDNLQLYLDLDVQRAGWQALEGQNGAVVAIDPRSAGVLALVSRPGFDANLFVTGISRKDYATLRADPEQPLFNRALQGQYPPGSTVKPFMGLAGLAYGVTSWQRSLYDPGYFQLPGVERRYRDWKHSGHGIVDLEKAVQMSCDVYFYTIGVELGIDRIHEFLSHFKFGRLTGIDIFGEAPGILPSKDWKQARMKQPWYNGDTVNASIGQGYMLATPLQLATAAAILARDGHDMSPRLADISGQEQPAVGDESLLKNPDDWKHMLKAMMAVTGSAGGTASYIGRGAKYTIAGKTGTAQVFSLQGAEYNVNMVPKKLRDHSLFIGFAPAEDPAIVVAVLVENGAHGSGPSAASVARRVMDAWLLDAEGKLTIQPAEPTPVSVPVMTEMLEAATTGENPNGP